MGWDGLNLVSSMGAYVCAAGVLVVVWDVLRPKRDRDRTPRNPWNAGTLEWLVEMPGRTWGIRSIPFIASRYPRWDQPDRMRQVDEGRWYLPDAEDGLRETLITSTLDGEPQQCLRVPGNSFVPMLAAVATGGAFIFSTFHSFWLAGASAVAAVLVILPWLWTVTETPRANRKDVEIGRASCRDRGGTYGERM